MGVELPRRRRLPLLVVWLAAALLLAAPAPAASLHTAGTLSEQGELGPPLVISEEDTRSEGLSTALGGISPTGRTAGGARAQFGSLGGFAAVFLVDGESVIASADVHAHFEDRITFHDSAGEGTFRGAFSFGGADFEALVEVASLMTSAESSFELTVWIGDTVMSWEGLEADGPGGPSSLRASHLRVGGVEIPGALPEDIFNAGVFVTPEIPYEDGVPLDLAVGLWMHAAGQASQGGEASARYAAGLLNGFFWEGMRDISPEATVWSMSGTDWSQPFSVPEPSPWVFVVAALGFGLCRRPRRQLGRD